MKQYYFNISMHDLQLSYTLCSVLFSTVQRNSSIELSRTSALGFPHLETQKEKRECNCPLRQKTLSPSKKYIFSLTSMLHAHFWNIVSLLLYHLLHTLCELSHSIG